MRECTVCRSCFPDHVETCERDGAPTKLTLPIDPLFKQRYRLLKRLGRGSISVVYHVVHEQFGTEHALKIILPEHVGNDSTADRAFLDQAQKAFALHHPNIVTVTEFGIVNEPFPFLVMDFIPSQSLSELLSQAGPLSPAMALEYLKGIGEGLAFAHAAGIVHGDLKPRNILLTNDRSSAESIKITDFGLSGIKSGRLRGPDAKEASGLLRSPLYLAPEEWSEDEADARSDIYSLGVVLYEMLAGAPPFSGKSNVAIMKSHLRDSPPSIAERFPGVTLEIENAVLHALEKDPANRPASVEDFVEEFGAALTNEIADYEPAGIEDDPTSQRWGTTIQPILLALGVVLVITLISVGIYYSRMSQ
jgi:eukaryotic-like serine/threonine-protein kinase